LHPVKSICHAYRFLVPFSIAAAIVFVPQAHAQPDFGPATRETDRAISDSTTKKITDKMRRPPQKVSITIDRSSSAEPSPADEQKFYVSDIVFTGMRTFDPGDFVFITKKYVKRELGSTDMNRLAKEIEMEYLKRGIVCVVFIPPQEIEDERLHVQVMEPDAQ
jgi:hemolysin activation/secretion protein